MSTLVRSLVFAAHLGGINRSRLVSRVPRQVSPVVAKTPGVLATTVVRHARSRYAVDLNSRAKDTDEYEQYVPAYLNSSSYC